MGRSRKEGPKQVARVLQNPTLERGMVQRGAFTGYLGGPPETIDYLIRRFERGGYTVTKVAKP